MFRSLLTALDDHRTEFLDGLDSVPAAQRDQSPTSRTWSPLQIGEHLYLVDHSYARFIARQIEQGEARRRFDEPSVKSVEGLIQAMRTPAQLKVPDKSGVSPTGDMPMEELQTQWVAVGQRWHKIAAALPPEWTEEAIAMHPVGGPLTFSQTLRFVESHIEHHLFQLARTVRALNMRPA